jgi:hypothetical protein
LAWPTVWPAAAAAEPGRNGRGGVLVSEALGQERGRAGRFAHPGA